MTTNQIKLLDRVLSARRSDEPDARHWGMELFGHWHRTAKSLQKMPMPQVCIESLGEHRYQPYAFYVHHPMFCECGDTILKMPYLIDFCPACRGVVKPPEWYENLAERI